MSPATEQLIRDYLNRLSVAARGQLGPDDRRALVNRTRDFIERQDRIRRAARRPLEVARLLSGLGDPAGLVQQERQRLATVRGDEPAPAAGRTRLARVLRRDQAKARSASWHWPVQEGSRTDLQVTLLDGSLNGPVPNGTVSSSTVSEHDAAAGANGAAPIVPAQGSEPSWFMLSLGSGGSDGPHAAATAEPSVPVDAQPMDAQPVDAQPVDKQPEDPELEDVQPEDAQPEDGPSKPRWPSLVADVDGADVDAADTAAPPEATPAAQLTLRTESVIARRAGRVARGFVAWYRRLPLEATAVVLLGVGGASYPPLWLLGAGVSARLAPVGLPGQVGRPGSASAADRDRDCLRNHQGRPGVRRRGRARRLGVRRGDQPDRRRAWCRLSDLADSARAAPARRPALEQAAQDRLTGRAPRRRAGSPEAPGGLIEHGPSGV